MTPTDILSGHGLSQDEFERALAARVTALHGDGKSVVVAAGGAMYACLARNPHTQLPGVGFVAIRLDTSLPAWSARVEESAE